LSARPASPELVSLSLHDALPICPRCRRSRSRGSWRRRVRGPGCPSGRGGRSDRSRSRRGRARRPGRPPAVRPGGERTRLTMVVAHAPGATSRGDVATRRGRCRLAPCTVRRTPGRNVWRMTERLLPSHLRRPVIGAPMAGGPSTPELVAAVGEAGGLGMIGLGYLDVEGSRRAIADMRAATDAPFGVNHFLLERDDSAAALDAAGGTGALDRYAAALGPVAERVGVTLAEDPGLSDLDQDAKISALIDAPVAVVACTFGSPAPEAVRALQEVGSAVVVTVATVEDARRAVGVGADWLSVQSAEAGGHRSTTAVGEQPDEITTLELTRAVRAALPGVEFVASGGISTADDVAAVLGAGADGVQVGTVLLRAPEAGTTALHRAALADPAFTETRPTR